MSALRSRSVLLVTVLGCAAALLVALLVGNASDASVGAAAGAPAAMPASGSPGTEIVSRRTQYSRTYRRPDGKMQATVSAVPINYRDDAGDWQPIDTKLRSDGQGGLEPTGSAVEVSLPHDLTDPAKVIDGSRWLSFELQDASAQATADSAGSTATYDDALPSVDAAYEAQAQGVKETLTLRDASAPATYRFSLDSSDGLTPSLRGDGSVVARDVDGHVRFVIPAPTVQAADQPEPTGDHVAYHLSGGTLSLVVDPAWLSQQEFPVKVDPTVWDNQQLSCTLSSGAPTTSACNGSTLKVGHDAGGIYRTVYRLTDTNFLPAGAAILHAWVAFTDVAQSNTAVTPTIIARGLGSTPTSSATWNTYNGTNAWGTPGGDMPATPIAQANALRMLPAWVGGSVHWDVSALVQSWSRTPSTNAGVELYAADETLSNVITLGGTTTAAIPPLLNIIFQTRPGQERDQSYEGFGIDDRSSLSANVTSGNFSTTSHDISLPGVAGMGLDVSRTYNIADLGNSHQFGSAWTGTVNGADLMQDYDFTDDARVIYANGGAVYRFDRDYASDTGAQLHYKTPSGIDADLTKNTTDGTTTLTFRSGGTKWIYGAQYDGYHAQLTQIQDRHGNHIDLHYRSSNQDQLDYITDTYGHNLTFNYDANGHLHTITQSVGSVSRTWTYNLDATHGDLTSFVNPDTKTTTYTYFDPALVGGTYDELKTITDARGHDTTLHFGGSTSPIRGDYDEVTSITRPADASSAHDAVWKIDYQATPTPTCSSTVTKVDGTTDAVVGRTLETDPEGHTTSYCYNKDGQVIQTVDGNGRKASQTYTASANVERFTGLAGTANPSLTTYSFATNGNALGSSTPTGGGRTQSSTIKYCGTGTGTTGTACSGTDSLDQYRPKVTTDTQGTSEALGYNSTGDVNDVTTTSGLDHQSMTYTAQGEIQTSTDGNNRVTTYGYTSHFLTSVAQPAPLAAQTFTADSIDRIASATDGNLITACPTYDGEDRITQVIWKSGTSGTTPCATGTTVKTFTFTFDADGNLTQRYDGTNTSTYGYDYLNRRTSEAFPSSRTNAYVYDRSSNLTSVTDPDGVVSYTYDPANRLTSVTSPKPTSGTDTITYAYTDPAGSTDPSKQTITYPGSGGVTGTGLKEESTSDAAGNVLSIKILNSSGTVLKSRTYSHDTSSTTTSAMIQSVSDEAGNVTSYTPGSANRLKQAKTVNGSTPVDQWDYLYDSAGNRTQRSHTVGAGSPVVTSYAYNTANQMCWSVPGTTPGTCTCTIPTSCTATPSGGTTYTYDANGQRTTGATYDALERLTAGPGSGSLGYLSPGNGELVSNGSTGYQNTMMGLSRQIPTSGSATDIIRATNGAPIAQRVGTTSKQELFSDALGSTIAIADDSANALSRSYAYDPDGNASTTGSGATTNLLSASGHQVGNLYHFGARYYDPATATWTQQDPINQIASLTQANRYAYAGGDPVDLTDPTGRSPFDALDPQKLLNDVYDAGAEAEHEVEKYAIRSIPKASLLTGIAYLQYKYNTSKATENCQRAGYCGAAYKIP